MHKAFKAPYLPWLGVSQEAKTRRSRDGTWARKGDKLHFGYKLHNNVDKQYSLIRAIETTTASVHDSQIDLSKGGETVYMDKGYFGNICQRQICNRVSSHERQRIEREGKSKRTERPKMGTVGFVQALNS
jgi:IS5 family transposase